MIKSTIYKMHKLNQIPRSPAYQFKTECVHDDEHFKVEEIAKKIRKGYKD